MLVDSPKAFILMPAGASQGVYLGSLSTGEGTAALVQRASGSPVEVGGFEGACLGAWAAGGRVSFHAQRAARRVRPLACKGLIGVFSCAVLVQRGAKASCMMADPCLVPVRRFVTTRPCQG